jgi:hypothetical protein
MDFILTYDKTINAPKLDKEIRALNISGYKGLYSVGTKVKVVFTAEIPQTDTNSVELAVTNHSVSDPAAYVSGKIIKAREFGTGVIVEFGTRNVMAGLTTAQISDMMALLNPVIASLVTGSLNVAVAEIDKITPNAILTAELKAEYRAKIIAFLMTL